MRHTDHKASPCPTCAAQISCGTSEGDAVPKEGSLGVCVCCGEFLRYEADLTMRKLSTEELSQLSEEDQHLMYSMRESALIVKQETESGSRQQ